MTTRSVPNLEATRLDRLQAAIMELGATRAHCDVDDARPGTDAAPVASDEPKSVVLATALAPLADVHEGKPVAMVGHEPHTSPHLPGAAGASARTTR